MAYGQSLHNENFINNPIEKYRFPKSFIHKTKQSKNFLKQKHKSVPYQIDDLFLLIFVLRTHIQYPFMYNHFKQ